MTAVNVHNQEFQPYYITSLLRKSSTTSLQRFSRVGIFSHPSLTTLGSPPDSKIFCQHSVLFLRQWSSPTTTPLPVLPDSHPSTPLASPEQSAPPQVASTSWVSPPTVISRESQLEDCSIGVILTTVERGQKLTDQQLKRLSPESRSLHQQWDSLQVKHGKLWRKCFLHDGTVSTLQLVVPHPCRSHILRELHDSPVGGHLGQEKVIGKLQQRLYWPGSVTDAKHWCNTCSICAARKTHPPRQQAPLHTVSAGAPMQIVAVDILGPLPQTSSGNRYILVAMDYFTRWA